MKIALKAWTAVVETGFAAVAWGLALVIGPDDPDSEGSRSFRETRAQANDPSRRRRR